MKRGFTMVELLVVIAIIGALATIGVGVGRSVLAKSRAAACLGNLRSLAVGLQSYLQDHGNRMPELLPAREKKSDPGPVLETELLTYLESAEAFHCPADRKDFEASGSSYFWNSTQSGKLATELVFMREDKPERIPLIFDKEDSLHPNGTNILFADMSQSNQLRFATGN